LGGMSAALSCPLPRTRGVGKAAAWPQSAAARNALIGPGMWRLKL
jgi:hypothetical protein